jgi:hypothetical protein
MVLLGYASAQTIIDALPRTTVSAVSAPTAGALARRAM